jgi:hypothetical protein
MPPTNLLILPRMLAHDPEKCMRFSGKIMRKSACEASKDAR